MQPVRWKRIGDAWPPASNLYEFDLRAIKQVRAVLRDPFKPLSTAKTLMCVVRPLLTVWITVCIGFLIGVDVYGQPASERIERAAAEEEISDVNLYYVTGHRGATLYRYANENAPLRRMPVRTPLHELGCNGDWCQVQLEDGEQGYVREEALSNIWIRVDKDQRRVRLYAGPDLVKTYNADFGPNVFLDKERRGSQQDSDHWRTPEGLFHVVNRNPNSMYYKALVIDYPGRDDAERGLQQGIISEAEYASIIAAHDERRMPPMSTKLGGWIEIHGDGTGASTDWTRGCVALHNTDMDHIWQYAEVGTPVLIE
ncbi:MAG: L,D-transpeptidase [Longimonas sp.]|uniref:L,D-transpeptidase n=1 Tax=Longimonas sp. TaxID=2039626 RepID=UPI003357B0EB